MRMPLAASLAIVGGVLIGAGQSAPDAKLSGQLKQLFPASAAFTPKGGSPPHFKALGSAQQLLGYAFWTTEIEPLERGYEGPIKMLVGLDTLGVLTGVVVVDHHEPYGNFSVEPPEFAAQFKGKSIRDPFRVGGDVDAVSRATITVTSATRAIRNSARRIARQLITPPPEPPK
jgi:NosR/NirI family nitrous oxide reductase transcriptional regulator